MKISKISFEFIQYFLCLNIFVILSIIKALNEKNFGGEGPAFF